eukprot:3742479-Pyramimonas_sp.AAC.2
MNKVVLSAPLPLLAQEDPVEITNKLNRSSKKTKRVYIKDEQITKQPPPATRHCPAPTGLRDPGLSDRRAKKRKEGLKKGCNVYSSPMVFDRRARPAQLFHGPILRSSVVIADVYTVLAALVQPFVWGPTIRGARIAEARGPRGATTGARLRFRFRGCQQIRFCNVVR